MIDGPVTEKSLASRLFDLSFEHSVTPQLIPILYFLFIVGAATGALLVLAAAISSRSVLLIAAAMVFAPLLFVWVVALARVALETAVGVRRMDKNIAYVARKQTSDD